MIKDLLKRRLALLLVALMVIGLVPMGALAEEASREATRAGTVNPGVTGLTASYDTGTWSANSTQHSISGSVKTTASTSCGTTTYTPVTGTLTLKNTSGAKATLSFKAAPTLNGGSATINGTAAGTQNYSFVLAANETVTIVITSSDSAENTTSIALTNISLVSEKNVTVTFTPAENGSYTVDGTAVTSNLTLTKKSTESFAVSAAPASGYIFGGWIVNGDTGNVLSTNAVDSLTFTDDATCTALFLDASTAVFDVGGKSFYSLPSAISYAQANSKSKITLISNGVLPEGDYTIPNGITLLIPFDAAQTVYTSTPSVVYGSHVMPTAYKTLTMASGASITVQSGGAICLSGQLSSSGQMGGWNGTPTGPDGRINMLGGSSITLKSGANLYCWGYIYGDGEVTAESGSTVYEAFQIKDWRGGTATSNVYDYAFIFNQYYIQNVEVPLKVYAGANVKLYSSVNAQGSAYPMSGTLVGAGSNSGGMFYISSGYVIKDYIESTDRLHIEVHGNISLSSMTLSGLPGIGSVNTSSYILPITSNLSIDIVSGTTSITQNIELLPGVEILVGRDAAFSISGGKKVYVYDNDDWGNFSGTTRMYPIGYSVANGTTAIRSSASLKDAVIDVNGTLTVAGSLFTSSGGADITSSSGTSGTNGKIVFSTAPTATSTIYEMENNSTKTSVSFYAPHLHNGDDSYSNTTDTDTSTWYYDKDGEHWYRYTVDFSYNGSIVGRMYYCENTTLTYDGSWLSGLGASVGSGSASVSVSGTNVNVSNVSQNSVVNLTGTSAQFVPTFVLNETQYNNYRSFTGNTVTETRTINGETYYVVKKADAPMNVGSSFAAPTDAEMGVTPEAHNAIVWNLSGVSATSGNAYNGTVPVGDASGDAYIYGFYTGAVAYNSFTDAYYPTLAAAMAAVPTSGTGTVRLVADCGSFEEESGAAAYAVPASTTLTLDLNGYRAVGRIVNKGTLILEMNGGSLHYESGATAAAAAYQAMAAVTNSGNLTVQDSTGGGRITADAISNTGVPNHSAVIRNYGGGTMSITSVTLENLQDVNSYVSVVMNDRSTITALTDVTILSPRGYAIFNYGGNIQLIDSCTVDCAYGIYNRNVRTAAAISAGYAIANYGTIDLIKDSTVTAGQYALHNGATINELNNTTFTAHPDSAQVNTYGTSAANVHGNVQCYTIFNGNNWWYDTNVWKRTDVTSGGYTRTDDYKEGEACRPTINSIIDCRIYAENTSTSADHGCALYNNGGIIGTIGGTTEIKTYKHPDNAKSIASNYALRNTAGGIIRSIEGTVLINASGYGALYNDGQFTLKTVNTYGDKIGGVQLHNVTTYGQPSEIESITANGTISAGSYYAIMNSGHIVSIASSGLTVSANNNALLNSGSGAVSSYDFVRTYTSNTDASTETKRTETYVRNLEKGGRIETIDGVHFVGTGTNSYFLLQNQGYIGTLRNADFTAASPRAGESYAMILNGDSRQSGHTLTREPFAYESLFITPYAYHYNYAPATIDVIDSITVTKNATFAFRNCGVINTLRDSSFTGTQYVFVNTVYGPYTERDVVRYYSGATKFSTTKNNGSDLTSGYQRTAATIGTMDNCTVTGTSTYAMYNGGHLGTLTNNTVSSANTTVLYNGGWTITGYTSNILDIITVTATDSACTVVYGNEARVNTTTYAAPVIDLIGEGSSFSGTYQVIVNLGDITAIDGGSSPVTVTSTTQKQIGGIYSYTGTLAQRINTTPYTDGTAGTATNQDTYLSAHIGSIRNTVITANGIGIQNGSANATYLPTIDELGEGLEIHANCTTAGYHAVYNTAYAKIAAITGGIYEAKTATTNAYKNNNTDPACATLISGGDFKGMAATRANAIFEPDNTNRQTYPEGQDLVGTEGVTFHDGTTADGFFFIGDHNNVTYTVTWKNWDGTVLETDTGVSEGSTPTYDGATPAKPATAEYTYTFAGWTPAIAPITGDTVYTATFTAAKNSYTVTWKMDDGSVIDMTTVEYGTVPTHADPTKAADAEYTYTFSGWTPELTAVTGDAVYTATFTAVKNSYTITWKMDDGSVIDMTTVEYGTVPTHADPTKAADAEYTYTFSGWTPELTAVTGDAVYTATFTAVKNSYTITWKMDDGSVIDMTTVEYGTVPTHADPTKAADAEYTYTFSGWTPELTAVTGDAVYTATFTAAKNSYTVIFVNDDGTVLQQTAVEYGTMPVYSGETPTKPATAEYTYTFAGWTPELAAVTGETTYTATFTATKNSYTITFINEDGTILQQTTVEYGTMPVFSGETPTKEATAQYTYTFANWTPEIVEVTGDATYTAVFTETVNKYTVTWVIDGETETEEYEYGAMPAHADPTKEATAQYTYTFSGWTPEVVSVTGNATYTAQFTETVNKYTVTWIIDGTEETEEYEYGAMPTHADPTKEATAQYTYTFSGWTPELAAVTGDATYTAQFTETVNKYTVTWIIDGTEETEEYEYGAMPTHADPTKEATAQYTYTFSGWTPAIAEVTGDATYTAVFTETVNTFTVTFLDWDGTVIGTETVAYGSAATAPAAPEHSGYAFTGWDTAFDNITADTTVTAQYAPSPTLIGDINLDGKVDSTDALLAMRYSMGITLIEGQGFVNGDVNGDGVLNATDGLLIMRIALAAE